MGWAVCLLAAACLATAFGALGFAVASVGGARDVCGAGSSLSVFLVLGIFCFVGATVISPLVGFGLGAIVVSSIAVALLLKGSTVLCGARRVSDCGITPPSVRRLIPLGVGLLFNVLFLLVVFTRSGLTPDHLVQQYDNPFHFSVVQHILDTGNASPIGAGSVMGAATAIYPSVWHALCALLVSLFGFDIQASGWVVALAFIAFIGPVGLHELYRRLQDSPSMFGEVLSVVLPVMLPLSTLEFSYGGCLYANVLGLCVVPVALTVVLSVLETADECPVSVRIFFFLASFVVVGFCHPNTVFVLGIFMLPFIVSRLSPPATKLVILAASLFAWAGCCRLSLFYRTINCADCIARGAEKGSAFISKLHLDYSFFVTNEWLLWALFAVALIVLVVCCIKIPTDSMLCSYAVGVCLMFSLTLVALFPQTLLAKYLVGFWYRDIKRLLVMTVFMGSLLVPFFIDSVSISVSERFVHKEFVLSFFGVTLLALIVIAVGVGFVGVRYYSSRLSPSGEWINGVGYAQLTDDDRVFFSQVANTVGDDVVLNNYNDSSVWLYSLYHVNALIKGRPANQISSMSDDLYTVVRGISLVGFDSAEGANVRTSLHRLRVRYCLQFEDAQNTTTRFLSNGQIDYRSAGESSVVTDDTPGFQKVLSDGRCTLYKVL